MENNWNERIDQFIQAQRENILRDIGRLVAVPSVEGPAAPGAPFGPGPRAALDEALAPGECRPITAEEQALLRQQRVPE